MVEETMKVDNASTTLVECKEHAGNGLYYDHGIETEGGPKTPDGQPIVIRFNPWHYMSVEQLVGMFFAELERGIGTASRKEITKKIGDALRALGSLASIFHSGAGSFIKEAGGAVGQGKSLPELKRELDKLLPDLAQRGVVCVDDIDRLDALRLLFRMIRLNADFPNVTYVLAFDRLVVEKNLDEPNGIRGRDYLEKIIQVSFDIPEPEGRHWRAIRGIDLPHPRRGTERQSAPRSPLSRGTCGRPSRSSDIGCPPLITTSVGQVT